MAIAKRILFVGILLVLAMVTVTYAALELDGVAKAETVDANGETRTTSIWYVVSNDALFLEAGNPENGWVMDLNRGSTLQLSNEALKGRYHYQFGSTPQDHQRIRAMMRAKYGWRDVWVSILFDVNQSQIVRVTPSPQD